MFDVDFDGWDEEAIENDPMSMTACTSVNLFSFSGNTLDEREIRQHLMGGEAMRNHSSVIFSFGKNPNDINKFYRKGRLILKKPDPPRIFIGNRRARAST